jgi:hypothetical protein
MSTMVIRSNGSIVRATVVSHLEIRQHALTFGYVWAKINDQFEICRLYFI